MKKIFTNILTLAALLITGVAFTACSSSDDSIVEQQPANPGEQVYTLTIKASKDGSATTRALKLETSGALTAYWANGDELTVYNETEGAALTGTLKASNASGSTATFSGTLSGTLSGTIAANDELTLSYHPIASISSYEVQDGTLSGTYGAEKYDMATATVTVKTIVGSDITINEAGASFTTQTAMIKFTLQDDAATPAMLNATSLKVSIDGEDLLTFSPTEATYTTNGAGILYFALPNADVVAAAKSTTTAALASAKVSFSATVGSDTYKITKTGYPFAAGKYYTSILTTRKLMTYNLGAITGNLTLKDGDTATGTLDVAHYPVKISIEAGATVTLNGVTINGTNSDSYKWAGITCLGDATIILKDGTTNSVKGFHENYPGIYVPSDKTLTIQGESAGTGKLIASSNGKGAGIGGGYIIDCGNIEIKGGDVTSTGGGGAAGIGSGYGGKCGNITISGGVVTANGGTGPDDSYGDGAGIGSGGYYAFCGNILISGGSVTATGGSCGAGIGSGSFAYSCGNIEISGGTVTATGGTHAAGIGTGYESSGCGAITITKGITKVTATKGSYSGEIPTNCIGRGENGGTVGTITIDGMTDWTAGTATTNLNFVVSETYYTNDTWTLTPKSTH